MANGADQEERKIQLLFWGAIWLSSVGRKDIMPVTCLAQGEDHVPVGYHLCPAMSSLQAVPPLRISESPASSTAIVEHR